MLTLLLGTALAAPAFLIETDPSTFAMGGGALHLRTALPAPGRPTLGLGVYGLDMPRPLTELLPANRGEGWRAHLRGLGAFADVHPGGGGLTVGGQLAVQQWRLSRPDVGPGRSQLTSVLLMPRVGYEWSPSRRLGLYVFPWVGAGALARVSGEGRVQDETYAMTPVLAFAAVHVGWRLGGQPKSSPDARARAASSSTRRLAPARSAPSVKKP